MSLRDRVHQLTRPHLTGALAGKPVEAPSLLEQLSVAVTSETRAGAASSGGRPIPIGSGALSLAQDIDRGARDELWEWKSLEMVGTTAEVIQAFEYATGDEAYHLEHVTLDWIDQIQAIIKPKKPPRRIHLECPSCGAKYAGPQRTPGLQVHCWTDNETLAPQAEWTAECVHCEAEWKGDGMRWLISALSVA